MSAAWIAADWPAPANIVAGTTTRQHDDATFPVPPQWLNQVHGKRVVRVGSSDFDAGPPAADAAVANRPGDLCVVRTADCLPVLICSIDGLEIAAVHAGWRGLAAGVIEATVAALAARPENLMAWFGPAISQPAFEVGAEVRAAFLADDANADIAFAANQRGRWQADLYQLARQRLARSGVAAIHGGGLCTFRDTERFYSYRRDGATGRLFSFIYRRE